MLYVYSYNRMWFVKHYNLLLFQTLPIIAEFFPCSFEDFYKPVSIIINGHNSLQLAVCLANNYCSDY